MWDDLALSPHRKPRDHARRRNQLVGLQLAKPQFATPLNRRIVRGAGPLNRYLRRSSDFMLALNTGMNNHLTYRPAPSTLTIQIVSSLIPPRPLNASDNARFVPDEFGEVFLEFHG